MFVLSLIALGIAIFVSWLYAIIEIMTDEFKNDTDKILWFLLVFFFPFVGTIVYFSIGRNRISLSPEPEEEYV